LATFLNIRETFVDGDPPDAGFFPLFFQLATLDIIGGISPQPIIDLSEQVYMVVIFPPNTYHQAVKSPDISRFNASLCTFR